ncbi:MAG TPA: hypothetical protein VKA18_15415, partial [Alphaproteobacteria bacterium]|nr:hypothetical protein [Alphaproteobacteria bacterium]
ERLQLIEQRILARENVLDVIDRLNLFADRPDMTPTDKVDRVRAATWIDLIAFNSGSRRAPANVSAFTITYSESNPQIAARVANELVTRVLELNLQARSQQAQQTHDFFRQEVERLAADLISLETEIANYKKQNEDALPTTLQARQGSLQATENQLFNIGQQRAQLEEQRRALTQRLETVSSLPPPQQNLTTEEQQLASLKTTLAQQETMLTERHPTIRELKAQIAAMERVVASAGGGPSGASTGQRLQIEDLQAQISALNNQLRLLDEQEAKNQERKADLERTIAQTPRIEAALNALQRRHADLQTRYQVAVQKQASAATGEKLELDQKAERFEVIEQARVPVAPVAPQRTLIAAGGAIGALGLGVALTLLFELLSSAIRTGADLERSVQLRPIVTVPYIYTRAEVRQRRIIQVMTLLVFIVVLPSSLWLVDQYVMPIEQISERVLEKTGLGQMWLDIKPRVM